MNWATLITTVQKAIHNSIFSMKLFLVYYSTFLQSTVHYGADIFKFPAPT